MKWLAFTVKSRSNALILVFNVRYLFLEFRNELFGTKLENSKNCSFDMETVIGPFPSRRTGLRELALHWQMS